MWLESNSEFINLTNVVQFSIRETPPAEWSVLVRSKDDQWFRMKTSFCSKQGALDRIKEILFDESVF